MTDDDLKAWIKFDEGGPSDVYLDSVGVPTLGWGHALHPGSFVPVEVSEIFFKMDFETACEDADFIIGKYDLDLDPVRRGVLVNMAFQLGRSKLLRFRKLIAALIIKDYDKAAYQITDSKAGRTCGHRYSRLAAVMHTGKPVL